MIGEILQWIPAFVNHIVGVHDASRGRREEIVKNWQKEDSKIVYPEPRGPRLRAETPGYTICFGDRRHFGVQARVLHVGELVPWYGMFAPCGRFLGTTGFARGAPSSF